MGELAPEGLLDLAQRLRAGALAGAPHVGEVDAACRQVLVQHACALVGRERPERALAGEGVVDDHVIGLGRGAQERPRVARDQPEPPVLLGPRLLEAFVEEEVLARQARDRGVHLHNVGVRGGNEGRQVLGQRVAAPAHDHDVTIRTGSIVT